MANPSRGECEIIINKNVYTAKATVNAACDVEDKTGLSVYAIGEGMSSLNGYKINTVAALLWAAIRAGFDDAGNAPTFIEVRDDIFIAGVSTFAEPCAKLISFWTLSNEQTRDIEDALKKTSSD